MHLTDTKKQAYKAQGRGEWLLAKNTHIDTASVIWPVPIDPCFKLQAATASPVYVIRRSSQLPPS